MFWFVVCQMLVFFTVPLVDAVRPRLNYCSLVRVLGRVSRFLGLNCL